MKKIKENSTTIIDDDNFDILKVFTKRYRVFNSERISSESEQEETEKKKNND